MASVQDLLNQRNAARDQMNQGLTGVTQNDAIRYLNDRVDSFQPLQQERRAMQAQAGNILPQQIQQYTADRQANPNQGPSALAALSQIMGNQNRTRATSDLLGDIIDTGKGRLGNIANDALSMLGQEQNRLKNAFDVSNQDYSRAYDTDLQDRRLKEQQAYQSQEAQKQRDFQAAQANAARRAAGGGGGGGRGGAGGVGRNPQLDALLRQYGQGGKGVASGDGPITVTDTRGGNAGQASQANNSGPQGNNMIRMLGAAAPYLKGFNPNQIGEDIANRSRNLLGENAPGVLLGNQFPGLRDLGQKINEPFNQLGGQIENASKNFWDMFK